DAGGAGARIARRRQRTSSACRPRQRPHSRRTRARVAGRRGSRARAVIAGCVTRSERWFVRDRRAWLWLPVGSEFLWFVRVVDPGAAWGGAGGAFEQEQFAA